MQNKMYKAASRPFAHILVTRSIRSESIITRHTMIASGHLARSRPTPVIGSATASRFEPDRWPTSAASGCGQRPVVAGRFRRHNVLWLCPAGMDESCFEGTVTRLEIEVRFEGRSRAILSLSGSLRLGHLNKLVLLVRSAQGLGLVVALNLASLRLAEGEALREVLGWRDLGVHIFGCPPFIEEWLRNDAQDGRVSPRILPA